MLYFVFCEIKLWHNIKQKHQVAINTTAEEKLYNLMLVDFDLFFVNVEQIIVNSQEEYKS